MNFEDIFKSLSDVPVHIIKGENEVVISAFVRDFNNKLIHAITNRVNFEGDGILEFHTLLEKTDQEVQEVKSKNA